MRLFSKNRTLLATVMTVSFFFLSTAYSQEVVSPLQFSIATDKNTYKIGDEIKFNLTIKNNSQEDRYVYIEEAYNAEKFNITNAAENRQLWEATVEYDIIWSEKGYVLIKAKESYSWEIKARILKKDIMGLVVDFGDSVIKLSGAGKFTVSATYKGWDGLTTDKDGKQIKISEKLGFKNVFVDSLQSNTITIEIK